MEFRAPESHQLYLPLNPCTGSPELFGNQKIHGTRLETRNLEERIWIKTSNKNIQSLGPTPSFAPTSHATFSIYYGSRRPGTNAILGRLTSPLPPPLLIKGHRRVTSLSKGFRGDSAVKNPPANTGDAGSITGSGLSPGEGDINPLQYSRLRNPKDRGAWQAAVHGVARSRT